VRTIVRRAIFLLMMGLAAASNLGAADSKHAPNLQFQTLSGNKVKIGDLHGSIAVVNFWATWCGPCREEFPLLSILAEKYAGKVRFVSISADNDPTSKKSRAQIDRFLDEQKPAMEIWLGADLDSLQRCGLGQVLPGTMILDANGQVVSRIEGQARKDDLVAPIEWLLNGQSGPAPPALVKRY
jgi:thiol-disulfide isomerase/thioredoxin